MVDNAHYRYGSARFADAHDARKAGLFEKTDRSIFLGFLGNTPLFHNGMGGVVIVAGARSGKGRDILSYNTCTGLVPPCNQINLDPKGEMEIISQNQTLHNVHRYCWNPTGLHGRPQHRINPLDYLRIDSPTLVADLKILCRNLIPTSGCPNAAYFEDRAREFLEGTALTLTEKCGVLNYPQLYHMLNLIPQNNAEYLDFAYDMTQSRFPFSRRIEAEIDEAREDSSGGFRGIMGQLLSCVSPLSDPSLMASVSPPYDFSLEEMCTADKIHQLYLMPEDTLITSYAPIIKSIFVAGKIYKSRAPFAPRQVWNLDEVGQLGRFPMIVELYTIDAGKGICAVTIWQTLKQMDITAPNGQTLITSNAAAQCHFAVRDINSAKMLSSMMGTETLIYEDERHVQQARHAKRQAVHSILNGEDPMSAGLNYAYHRDRQEIPAKQARPLRTPDEIINTDSDKMYIFSDGLPGVLYADRKAYYEQPFMAGRYHPNPYHTNRMDRVKVKTRFGHAWRKVIQIPVPEKYAHLPQYKDGIYSYIEGAYE